MFSPNTALAVKLNVNLYLFWVLHHALYLNGYVVTGSSKGRGNQYIQFAKALYCKLLTYGKQLPAFPHGVRSEFKLWSRMSDASVTNVLPCPKFNFKNPKPNLEILKCLLQDLV